MTTQKKNLQVKIGEFIGEFIIVFCQYIYKLIIFTIKSIKFTSKCFTYIIYFILIKPFYGNSNIKIKTIKKSY